MKLLIFNEMNYRGGGNRYIVDNINAVSELYNEIEFLINRKELFLEDAIRLKSTVMIRKVDFFSSVFLYLKKDEWPSFIFRIFLFLYQKFQFIFFIFNVFKFYFVLNKYSPDHVLSCNGGYPAALSSLAMVVAAKLAKIPVILSIVSVPSKRIFSYEKFMDKIISKCVNGIVVNSKNIATELKDLRDMPFEKIDIIQNTIEDRPLLRGKKHLNSTFNIGFISRLDKNKGVLLLLDAFRDIVKKYKNARLILVGDGDSSDEVKTLVSNYNLQNKVKLLGYYNGDVFDLLCTFDLYVFPSFWEGIPYSLVEALCAGCPILATNVGGIPEIIDDGINGILINPLSKDEIVKGMEKLMCNKSLRSCIAKNGRRKFEKLLCFDEMQHKFRESFKNRFLIHKNES